MINLFLSGIIAVYSKDVNAQSGNVKVTATPGEKKIEVTIDDKPFTALIYPDSLEKPVLYPIYAADGELITRGFPLAPRLKEPVDHPHHIGLWLNYESVNGLDFWNNSSAIPAEKKAHYGWINNTKITDTRSGTKGAVAYEAQWQNIQKQVLLRETTTLLFSGKGTIRIIDRITTLTAELDVAMPDIKDGFLGLRVARELELPSKEVREYADANGIVTKVKPSEDASISGNYITSEGKEGDAAWGTRAKWCLLYGKKGNDSISIAIIDHPENVGYPTYWHARGYGLFAANPLGQKVFSNGKEVLNYSLKKGESVTFRYRVVINAAAQRLTAAELNDLSGEFAGVR